MPPLVLAAAGTTPLDLSFVAIAAQNVAMLDVRGDYRLRFALLLAMAGIFAGAAAIGATASASASTAVLATGLIAVLGGVWRHLSSDYGAPIAISSSLLFFLALSYPEARSHVGSHALAALLGGCWGVLVQVTGWPFRPQHPLRRAVAESWLAVAHVADALGRAAAAARDSRGNAELAASEAALRTTLDQAYGTLALTGTAPLRALLEPANLAAARLATRVVALDTALDAARAAPDFPALARDLEPTLAAVGDLARGAAVTLVSRQPAHLAAFDIRLRQVAALLGVLRAKIAPDAAHAQLAEIIRHLERTLPEIHAAIRATVERAAEAGAVGLELRELRTLSLRPLASALNLSTDIEPALLRFTLRLAALTMAATAIFQRLGLPHGYWLPFTIVVVLQPDYGSTRQRAFERLGGTMAGSVLASALLYLQLPLALQLAAIAGGVFAFAYFLKRNYAAAVFFVTVFIVLVTEAHEPVTLAFTIERLGITLAGGALALLAAFIFWPVWERDRLPPILARTFTANREFLGLLLGRLARGEPYDGDAIAAKRRAESANSAAFSSLRRLSGDPRNRREGLEHAAALVNGNQRLTRLLNVLALHLRAGEALQADAVTRFGTLATDALSRLAQAAENGVPAPAEIEPLLRELEGELFPAAAPSDRERWVFDQLSRAATELSALLLTLQSAAPAWREPAPAT